MHLESLLKQRPDPAEKESMVLVLLIFFMGLIVLLSINWSTNPPTFEPLVLLIGILVAAIIWIARRAAPTTRQCLACGRFVPAYSVFCPICGQRIP